MRKIDLTNFQVATSETARHINRRIALNIIRRHQPMSRAELARRSGLQRSTVSAIIEQLIGEGWVTEGASPTSARGRRPRFLHLNVERAGIVAVDLRPGITRVGLAGLDARFVMQTEWPTPAAPEEFARTLAQTVTAFRAAHPDMVYEGVGVSLPGRVDEAGTLVFAPNLGWGPVNLRRLLESTMDLPVVLENAASACALAELWFGRHADNVKDLVAVTVSEGVGVGLLLNGQLFHGADSLAGEFGHVTLDDNGPPCSCGKRGCWEQYASNSAALARYLGMPAAPGPPGQRSASRPDLTFADLLRLADDGDARAVETIDAMVRYLGIGLAHIVTGLAPQVLVVVGEITAAWSRVGPVLEDVVRSRSMSLVRTRIVPTDPATQPRLRGAVTLVVQQHLGVANVA
jgi:predicted NBD/HSP70 family sugar kinase